MGGAWAGEHTLTTAVSLCTLQLSLTLDDSSISTKGTKSGTFVMYNCARLATLFDGYTRSKEQGLYPALPPVASLDFSLLQDEVSAPRAAGPTAGAYTLCHLHSAPQGEWLLLFNGVLPFPELLDQAAALPCTTPGLQLTARTETVRFTVAHTQYSLFWAGM